MTGVRALFEGDLAALTFAALVMASMLVGLAVGGAWRARRKLACPNCGHPARAHAKRFHGCEKAFWRPRAASWVCACTWSREQARRLARRPGALEHRVCPKCGHGVLEHNYAGCFATVGGLGVTLGCGCDQMAGPRTPARVEAVGGRIARAYYRDAEQAQDARDACPACKGRPDKYCAACGAVAR